MGHKVDGIGICVTGNVMIDKRYLGEHGNVLLKMKATLKHLKWATAATKTIPDCWVQLNHPGKNNHQEGLNKENVAPPPFPFLQRYATRFCNASCINNY